MAVCPPLVLYAWYHHHKKKDLGVGQKDWLQFLQEQVREDGQKKYSTNTSAKTCERITSDACVTMELQVEENTKGDLDKLKQKQQQQDDNYVDVSSSNRGTKLQCSLHQKEEEADDWSQSSSFSQGIEGTQVPSEDAPVTPLLSLLDTPFNSPMLLLPQSNNTTVEEAHTLPLCSPTLPLCDAFSPAKREGSPRDTIMESLAGNLDGSEVSWSSALATPTNPLHGHNLDSTSPSTLERQTLHPRQRLRENVLARSLFSPRTSEATTSSSSGELSPGLGIIKCFSPVPRFSCRSVSSTHVKRPCSDESSKPDWLEAGTQRFRVDFSSEKKVTHEKKVVVIPEGQQGSSIKPILGDSGDSHSPQINLSQDCVVVRPDQTSTPAQPRALKARHLALNAQSPELLGFIEPIPLVQGIKEDEREQETNLGPHEKDITDAGSCDDYKSDVSEYSDESAEDPFDIICSPVSKVKQRKKSNADKDKLTLGTSKFKSKEEALPGNPINYANEKIKGVLMEAVSSHSGMSLGVCANKNMHPENRTMSEEKSLWKDGFNFNMGKSEIVEDTDPEVKLIHEEHTVEITCCLADTGHQTEHSIKKSDLNSTTPLSATHPIALFAKTNSSTNKQCMEISSEDKKEYISVSSKQKRKSIEIPSLYKKRKLTKGFVYPTDLGDGYEELNVSYTETIGGDEKWNKTPVPGSKGTTCSTPNNELDNEKQSEAVMLDSKGSTCSTPTSRTENERWLEVKVPDGKTGTCNTPTTLSKAAEEVLTPSLRQKKFLPLSNLENQDNAELSSRSSFESLHPAGYEQVANSFRIKKKTVDIKESRDIDRQHCTLRVVPVASVVPCEGDCTKEIVTAKGSPLQIYNVDSNKIQKNVSTPSRNIKKSSVRTKCNISSIVHPVGSKNQEGQCQVDLPKLKQPEPKPIEDMTTQGNEEPRKQVVSSSLNSQLVGDTFSDIDFSDSDLDISFPLEEKSATSNDKNTNPEKKCDLFAKIVHREESFDGNHFNRSTSESCSGFIGFMTGHGKQVKVSDKALQQARKLLEEQTWGEQNLGPQQVPPGKSVSMDYSDIFHAKRETSHLKSTLFMATNYNNCTLSEKGSLTLASNLPSDTDNEETSKLEQKVQDENIYSVPEMHSSCNGELVQAGCVKGTSSESSNRAMTSTFTHGDNEASKGSVVQDSCDDLSRKTVGYSVTQSIQLKSKNTGGGFQDFGMAGDVGEVSKVLGRAHLLCEENSSLMCIEDAKVMEDTETTNRSSLEPKADTFQGFSTAAGLRVNVSKEALRKAQMLWEEEKAEKNMQPLVNEINIQCGHNVSVKNQSVGLRRSAVPAESNTTIEVLKNEGEMVDQRDISRTLETEIYFNNDCHSLNQENCDLKKLSKNALPSTLMDEVKWNRTRITGDYKSGGLSLASSQQVIEKDLNKAIISFPTLPAMIEPCSSRKGLCKDISDIKNNTTLEMDVGFHIPRGKKASVNEASIAQAQLLWKETCNYEVIKPQQQQSTLSDLELHEGIDIGFQTGKGKKISVNKASITQACLLWKETASSEVTALDHKAAQEQQSTHMNDEMLSSRKLVCKPDGLFLGYMKAASKSHSLQINYRDFNSSSSKRLSVEEILKGKERFATSRSQGDISDTNTKINERRRTCDETSTNPQSRNADMFTVLNTDSSSANDGEIIQSENLLIRPRRLFEDKIHSRSVTECRSPTSLSPNSIDLKSDGKSNFHERKINIVEGTVMYVPRTVTDKSRTASHAFCMNPLHPGINQNTISRLSVEEDIRTEEMKTDLQQSMEANDILNIRRSQNLREGANQKMVIGHHTKSTNVFKSINHRENVLLEAKNVDISESKFCNSLTGKIKQVKVNKKSLQQGQQLLQQCMSSEASPGKTSKPSFGLEKNPSKTDKRQIATVEPFVVTVDQNARNADENRKAMCRSPILGSQKRSSKVKTVAAYQTLKTNSVNTQEISDISDVTEAFLKDYLLDCEDTTKESSSQRKRFRRLYLSGEEDSLASHKKMRRNVVFDQPENLQGCGAREAARILAREKQGQLVQQKENQTVQPVPGFLYKLRTEKKQDRIKLHSFGTLKVYRKGRRKAFSINFCNALDYRFDVKNPRCDSIECDDGCVVLLGSDGCVGVEEVELGFLAMPGVHPGLLPPSWIPNHYRLIVWQLAALERRLLDCQALAVENVVSRLKYRYDREIDRAERSILRKVTEQDDVPQKTMVLCVASVKMGQEVDTGEDVKSRAMNTRLLPLLELTDGWYSISAVVDKAMAQLIEGRRVEVGTKLVLHGSELVGATSPCHPLQAPSTLRLRLHTNMTRRARWWARLGLLPQSGPLPSLIEATHSGGGVVGQVKVMVARIYLLYYERSQDGSGLFMGEKAYLKKLRETERQRELLVEQITAEVEKEHQQEKEEDVRTERRTMTPEEIRGLTLGREISRLLDETADPSCLEGLLTSHQVQLARTWRERRAEEVRRRLHTEVTNRLAKKQKPYEAVPLLKMRIVDGEHAGALVTVWRPSVEFREMLSEGSFFSIRYLVAAGFRWGSRQFISTQQTRWEQCFRGPILWREEFARSVTPLCLTTSRDLSPLWREMDVTGVVLRVGTSNLKYQTVYLVDHHLNILAVNFWGGLKKCGYEDSVVEGTVICLMNCSWRGYSGGIIGCVHFTEHSIATFFPSTPHLVEAVTHLRNSIKDMKSLLNEADKKLDELLDSRAFSDKSLHSGEKSVEWKHAGSMEEKSPQANEENRGGNSKVDRQEQQAMEVQNKLKLLSQYGSPGCSPGILSPASLRTHKPFRAPQRKPQKNSTTNGADEHN